MKQQKKASKIIKVIKHPSPPKKLVKKSKTTKGRQEPMDADGFPERHNA